MPATVEGVFRIIDRASAPLRRIERQALKTEAALKTTGERMDSIGTNRQLRQYDATQQRLRNVGRESKALDRDMHRMGRSVRGTKGEFDGMSGALRKLAGAFAGLKALAIPGVFLAVLSAAKPLLGVISALAGGVVALLPKLGDLAGVAGALPATFTGIGLAVGTAKLAFNDLGKALGGNKNAIKALTPEGRNLLRTLKQYQPVLKSLRREAQQGLFPGVEYSIRRLQRAVPMIRRLIGRMSREMGRQAGLFANFLTSPDNLRDMERLGNQGIRIFRRMGSGLRNIAAAFLDIASAARPFTDWLTKTLLQGTRDFRRFIDEQRRNGGLTRFFERAREALERFWSISKNVFRVIHSIMQAARPLGDLLWASIDRVTKRWADFLGTDAAQRRMRDWFMGLRPILHEVAGLFGDLGRMIGRLVGTDTQGAATSFVAKIRGWVPILENILNATSALFGTQTLDAITQFGRLFANMTAAGKPLPILLGYFTTLAGILNDLIEKFPVLGTLMGAAFTVIAFASFVKHIRVFLGVVNTLAASWRGVATAADMAAAAQARAMGVPGPRGGGPGGGVPPVGGGGGGGGGLFGRGGGGRRPGFFRRLGTSLRQRSADLTLLSGGGGESAEARTARAFARQRLAQPGVFRSAFRNSTFSLARSFGRGRVTSGLAQLGATGGRVGRFLGRAGGLPGIVATVGGQIAGQQLAAHGHSQLGGVVSGAATGAGIGALAGSVIPVIGTGAGAAIGGLLGGAAGFFSGRKHAAEERVAADQTRISNRVAQLGGDAPTSLRQEHQQIQFLTHEIALRKDATGAELELRNAMKDRLGVLKEMNAADKVSVSREKNQLSRQRARDFLVDMGRAFDIYSKKFGPDAAMDRTVNRTLTKMRNMRNPGAKIIGENVLQWAQQQAKSNPKFQKEVDRLIAGIKKRWRALGVDVQVVNGQILTGTKTEWRGISDAMKTETEKALEATHKNFTAIQREAVGSLMAMGFTRGEAKDLVAGTERAGGRVILSNAVRLGAGQTRAQGAAQTAHAQRTGDGPGIGGPADADRTARAASTARAAAAGGGINLMGANPNLMPYARLAGQYGLHVSSGLRPGAVTSSGNVSWHASGHAIDVAGSPTSMLAFFNAMKSQYGAGLEELIYTPGGVGIKNGQPFTYTGQVAADHFDHVHVADKDPGGVAGGVGAAGLGAVMQMPNLVPPGVTVGGAPGLLAQSAGVMQAAGLTMAINAALAQGTAIPGGGLTTAGGKYNKSALIALWNQANPGLGDPGLMAAIALAESSGSPTAHNPSGASGLWQILGNPFPGNPFDPFTNARMAGAKLRSQGLGAWEAYTNGNYRQFMGDGPGIPWLANGGDFVASKPTLIGVGDGPGSERVTVTPQGKGSGGSMHVAININGGSNVEAQVHRALVRVARELDLVPIEEAS